MGSNLCSIEFIPLAEKTQSQPQPQNEYMDLEGFFSTFSDKIGDLNLIERDTNTIHNLVISFAKNLNRLNELLISDANGFTAIQVDTFTCFKMIDFENISNAHSYYTL